VCTVVERICFYRYCVWVALNNLMDKIIFIFPFLRLILHYDRTALYYCICQQTFGSFWLSKFKFCPLLLLGSLDIRVADGRTDERKD
jgi:hypothetical protein